ncbi:MAG: hypothetical protein JO257_08360 [Deltaproteobacteria bacterium]|nr:hypothetical protein [Deltaproteobacteria bacterium]
MGNPLRLLHSPLSSNEEKATHELFRLGMLHRLDVSAYVARGGSVDFSVYFAPFHMPGVATSQLSPDAIALKDSLP